jgi:hypothetical protein
MQRGLAQEALKLNRLLARDGDRSRAITTATGASTCALRAVLDGWFSEPVAENLPRDKGQRRGAVVRGLDLKCEQGTAGDRISSARPVDRRPIRRGARSPRRTPPRKPAAPKRLTPLLEAAR